MAEIIRHQKPEKYWKALESQFFVIVKTIKNVNYQILTFDWNLLLFITLVNCQFITLVNCHHKLVWISLLLSSSRVDQIQHVT